MPSWSLVVDGLVLPMSFFLLRDDPPAMAGDGAISRDLSRLL